MNVKYGERISLGAERSGRKPANSLTIEISKEELKFKPENKINTWFSGDIFGTVTSFLNIFRDIPLTVHAVRTAEHTAGSRS